MITKHSELKTLLLEVGFIVNTHPEKKDYHQFIGFGIEGYYIETKMVPFSPEFKLAISKKSEANDSIKNYLKNYENKHPKEIFNRDVVEGPASFIMIPRSVSFLGRVTAYNSKYLTEVLTNQGNSEAPKDSFYSEAFPIDFEHYLDNLKLLGSEAGYEASKKFNLKNIMYLM